MKKPLGLMDMFMTLSVVMVSLVSVYAQTSNYAPHIRDFFFFFNMSAVSQCQNKKRKVIWEKLGLRRGCKLQALFY